MGDTTFIQNATCTLTLNGENTYLDHSFSKDSLCKLIDACKNLTPSTEKKLHSLLSTVPKFSKIQTALSDITLVTSLHPDGSRYLWAFNERACDVHFILPTAAISLLGHYITYDVLEQKELGFAEQTFSFDLRAHHIGLFQII